MRIEKIHAHLPCSDLDSGLQLFLEPGRSGTGNLVVIAQPVNPAGT